MRAKIEINEAETRTKIRAKYLRAMENEEWDLLPGEVYARSFLRTYAEYLGLDARELTDDFKRLYEHPSDHEAPPITPARRGRREPRERRERRDSGRPRRRVGVPPWAVIGVVLAAVVVALVLVGKSSNTGGSTSARSTTSAHRARTHVTHRHAATRPPAKPHNVTLQLQPTGQVYVCLVAGSGQTLIPGRIFVVGQTIPTETRDKLLLTLGNANVKMKVNGVPVAVAASSSPLGYLLTPGSHAALPSARQPTCS